MGSQELLEGIERDKMITDATRERIMQEVRGYLRPEFLNRLDEMILFTPLRKEHVGEIIKLLMKEVNKRLADREIRVRLTDEAEAYVVENGYDPVYGARPLKRFVQKHVETLAAKLILSDKVRLGEEIEITLEQGELKGRVL